MTNGDGAKDDVDSVLAEIESLMRRLTDFAIGEGHGDTDPSTATMRRLQDVREHLRQAFDATNSSRAAEGDGPAP